MRQMPVHATVVAYLALFVALGIGAYAVAGTPTSPRAPASPSIRACYERATGDLRILLRGVCRRGERYVAWRRTGPRGAPGPAGAPGATGPAGAPGAQGATGTVDTASFYTKGESDARFASSGLFGSPAPAEQQGSTDNTCLLSEMRLFAGARVPESWALARGQLLSISQNTALFSLIGNAYGGNGQSTFALPDMRGVEPKGGGNSGVNYIICIQGLFP